MLIFVFLLTVVDGVSSVWLEDKTEQEKLVDSLPTVELKFSKFFATKNEYIELFLEDEAEHEKLVDSLSTVRVHTVLLPFLNLVLYFSG